MALQIITADQRLAEKKGHLDRDWETFLLAFF